MSSVCSITSQNIKLGSDKPVGVGVAPGAVLLDSNAVYSGTATPNMVTGATELITSSASSSVTMIVYDGLGSTSMQFAV